MYRTKDSARQIDYTFLLTNMKSKCIVSNMARLADIKQGISDQVTRQTAELAAAQNELNKLRDAAQKFRELEDVVKEKGDSMRVAAALLAKLTPGDGWDEPADVLALQLREESGIYATPEDMNVSRIPLWKIVREILKQTSTIRVYELQSHLNSFGVSAERSAIESALATHKKDFKIEKRNREKYVSLR